MNKEAAEARPALQEEYDLLPAYIDKAMLAFRQVEKDMKYEEGGIRVRLFRNSAEGTAEARGGPKQHKLVDPSEAEEAQALCCWRGHQP